jgi:hypothetical protein
MLTNALHHTKSLAKMDAATFWAKYACLRAPQGARPRYAIFITWQRNETREAVLGRAGTMLVVGGHVVDLILNLVPGI